MSYLALQYTPEKLIDWLRRADGTESYYARDFERVYGKPLAEAWQDWIRWEHEFQEANLKAVREHPITPYTEIARRGLGAISRSYLSKDKTRLYAAVRYAGPCAAPGQHRRGDRRGHRTRRNRRRRCVSRVVACLRSSRARSCSTPSDNLTYRNLNEYDLKTGATRELFAAARIGDLAYNPVDRSLWGLRTNNGFVMVVRIPYPYREWQTLHVYPFGEVPFDLDVSPDGKLVSLSMAAPDVERSGVQVMQLRVMSAEKLLAGDPTPLHKFELGTALPEGFTFSPDGRYLYGSSYYTGVSNIYRYELATQKLEALSNAEVGFFRPLPLDDQAADRLPLRGRRIRAGDHRGPAHRGPQRDHASSARELPRRTPIVQRWGAGPPSQVDYQVQRPSRSASTIRSARCRSSRSFRSIEGYKDSVAFGAFARFSDPIGFDNLNLTLSYSPDD